MTLLAAVVLQGCCVSWLELQSASQPRLSYAEMAEDYPRYPDIHDLDLTLLNPRMIVVRRAVPRGLSHVLCPCLSQAVGDSCFLFCRMSPHI